MKNLNKASLPLNFAGGKYSTESVKLPDGQYIIKIVATGPCIGKILKGSEVIAEVDFSSYKMPYNDLRISFILASESDISLEVTTKREDIKVYSASLYSSLLPIGGDEYPTPTGTINITENGENIDVKQYAKANVNVNDHTTQNKWAVADGGATGVRGFRFNVPELVNTGGYFIVGLTPINFYIDLSVFDDFNVRVLNTLPVGIWTVSVSSTSDYLEIDIVQTTHLVDNEEAEGKLQYTLDGGTTWIDFGLVLHHKKP